LHDGSLAKVDGKRLEAYLQMGGLGFVTVCESDKAQAGLFHHLLVRSSEQIFKVRQNVLDHGDAVVLNSSTAVRCCLDCRPLYIGREKV